MMRNILVIALLGIFCLTGCTMIPAYTRPAAPVPQEWPTGPAYKEAGNKEAGGQSAPDLGWRGFVMDERLRTLIDLAIRNNRDLRVAALNIERARAQYQIRGAQLVPAVGATAYGSEQRLPADVAQSNSGTPTVSRQYGVGVGFSFYEIDFFGRIRSLREQALQQYLATEQARVSAQISLIAEVANAYLFYAADCESLKLTRETLESQEASYKLIERRYSVGTSSELDLRQAQTRVEAARVDIALFTRLVAEDENILAVLVGVPVPRELLPGEFGSEAMFKDVSVGASSEVLLQRPDILQAEYQLKAANANIGAARAAFFPSILLTTSAGTMSNAMGGLFKYGSDTWTFAPQITMPIFDARLWPALDAIKVEREIVLAQYEKAIQVAFKEVANALAQRGTVGDQLKAQESLVKASAEAYRLSDARYIRGIDSYLGVLDSQRSLYAAQLRLISIHLSKLTNQVTLYKVLGGGWKE